MHRVLTDTGVLFVLVPVRCGAAAHGKGFRLYSIKKNKGKLSLSSLVHTTYSSTSRLSGQCDLSKELLFTQYSSGWHRNR
jgi:hypothetical protein